MQFSPSKNTSPQLELYLKDVNTLNALFYLDIINEAQQGKLILAAPHIVNTYLTKLSELIKKHDLTAMFENLNTLAKQHIQQHIAATLSWNPNQEKKEKSTYEDWKKGEAGNYKFGFLTYNLLEKMNIVGDYKPTLQMESLDEVLENLSQHGKKGDKHPKNK